MAIYIPRDNRNILVACYSCIERSVEVVNGLRERKSLNAEVADRLSQYNIDYSSDEYLLRQLSLLGNGVIWLLSDESADCLTPIVVAGRVSKLKTISGYNDIYEVNFFHALQYINNIWVEEIEV